MNIKKFITNAITAIALAVFSITACKKTGSSPSSNASQLSFEIQADNAVTNLPSSSTGLSANSTFMGIAGLTFSSGTAKISRFSLKAKRNGIEIEISSKNLTNIDLYAVSPRLAGVTLDTGTYREIEISAMLRH